MINRKLIAHFVSLQNGEICQVFNTLINKGVGKCSSFMQMYVYIYYWKSTNKHKTMTNIVEKPSQVLHLE